MRRIFTIACLLLSSTAAMAKDTIVVVIDASLSMNDKVAVKGGVMTRMNVAKESLKRVLPNITGDVDLGIVVFSAGNLAQENDGEWVYPVGKVVREKVIAAIDKPEPSGGTPLGDYIKVGADKLLDRRQKSGNSGRYRLILVTDGENNSGIDPQTTLQDVKRKGIQTDLIGLNMGGDHSLAQTIVAMPTPGTYQSAQDADQLVEAVANVTREAPVTASGGIDPIVFDEIAPLDDKLAGAMIKMVSNYNNTPIGDPDPVLTAAVDDQGNVTVQSTTPATPARGTSGGTIALIVCGMVVAVVVVVVIMSIVGR